jgi:hypothetical protein
MTLRFTSPQAAMESSSTWCMPLTSGLTLPLSTPWNWKVWRVVRRREGEATCSESGRARAIAAAWRAAGQAHAQHEG